MRQRPLIRGVVFLVVILAVFGLGQQIFTDFTSFIQNILSIIGIIALLYVGFHFIFRRNTTNRHELKKYKQAAKASKKRYKDKPIPSQSKRVSKINKKRTPPPHLRVIDGKKGRKNDQASL